MRAKERSGTVRITTGHDKRSSRKGAGWRPKLRRRPDVGPFTPATARVDWMLVRHDRGSYLYSALEAHSPCG